MATTNKNEWVNTFAKTVGNNSINNNNVENDTPNQNANTDKYNALEFTSYKDMLSSKVQANVAREQAQKYVSTALNANGYGTQGLSESTQAGIQGTYNKAIQNADATHQANLLDIENQRQADIESASESQWQSAMTMLQQASSQQDLDYVKNNFYANMTPEQKKYFDYYYASYSNSLSGADTQTGATWNYEDGHSAYAYDKNGDAIKVSDAFNVENETLNNAVASGRIAKGTYIQLHNERGQNAYLYYSTDGQIYYVSQETYNDADENKKVNIVGSNRALNSGSYQK